MEVSREEQKREMERLARERMERRGERSSKYGKRVINFDVVGGYKKGVFYKPKASQQGELNKLDVVPYLITTDKHPLGLKPGHMDYMLDIFVHRYVGPHDDTFLCLTKYNGTPCPICEEWEEVKVSEKYRQGSKDQKEALEKEYVPKRRCFYNVLDADLPENQQQVQIFEEVWHWFDRKLQEKVAVRMSLNDHGVQTYYDVEKGKTILVNVVEKKSSFGNNREYSFEDFLERAPFHPDILKETYSLDAMLVVPTYEEVRNAFYGVADSGAMRHEESAQVEPVHHERTARRMPTEATQSVQEATQEESDSQPTRRLRETATEAPVSRRREVAKEPEIQENKCPYNHNFGYDCDKFSREGHCTACAQDVWQECANLCDELARKGEVK